MDKNRCEIFGAFAYAESMTYETLLANENFLLEKLENIFADIGAEHLDFTPLGDILMTQCAFEVMNLEVCRAIAKKISVILPEGVRGKLMCLDKNLDYYHIFWLKRGQWRELEVPLPNTAPDNAQIHMENLPLQKDSAPETAE